MWKRLSVLWTVVRGDARLLWRALRHPHSPGWLKLGTLAIVAYVLWPVDLIPDFIPFLGAVDDIVLVPLAIRFLLDRLPGALRAEISQQPLA
ncbi:MAG: YkvA family protein [Rubrivivax sp.]